MTAGRPTTYTEELANVICGRMSEGESLRSICRDPEMPAISSIFVWISKDSKFSEQYKRAMEFRADALFEELFDIADDSSKDTVVNADGSERMNSEYVQRSRLRVDTRKWALSKMMPKKYSDKQQIEHSGSINTMSEEDLDKRIAELSKSND